MKSTYELHRSYNQDREDHGMREITDEYYSTKADYKAKTAILREELKLDPSKLAALKAVDAKWRGVE